MRIYFLISLVVSMIAISGCQETNPVVPDAYTINGTIAFADSNFSDQGTGKYMIYAWDKNIWFPLAGNPTSEQEIEIVKENNKYVLGYRYRLANVNSGSYVVSIQYIDGSVRKILGIYSCNLPLDSACLQTPSEFATIVTTEGLINIDFNSNADTSVVINP